MARYDRRLLRLVLLLLLALMPLRMAWSAAAGYCAHEPSSARAHFGHHTHADVDTEPDSASAQPHAETPSVPNLSDPDCSACHAWVAHLDSWSRTPSVHAAERFLAPPVQRGAPSHRLADIERPKWASPV